MTYTPSPHHEHEERERVEGERLAREERRRYGATTVQESLACLKEWAEWNKQQKEMENADRVDNRGTVSGRHIARSA